MGDTPTEREPSSFDLYQMKLMKLLLILTVSMAALSPAWGMPEPDQHVIVPETFVQETSRMKSTEWYQYGSDYHKCAEGSPSDLADEEACKAAAEAANSQFYGWRSDKSKCRYQSGQTSCSLTAVSG